MSMQAIKFFDAKARKARIRHISRLLHTGFSRFHGNVGKAVLAALALTTCSPNPASETDTQVAQEPVCKMAIAATGQSNMLGSNDDLTGTSEKSEAVKMYNWRTDTWQVSEVGVYPPYGNSYPATNNLAHHFGMRMHEETGCDVYIILRARGTMLITHWDSSDDGERHEYDVLDNATTNALATIGLTKVDVILWGQGESNELDDPEDYKEVFLSIVENFGAEPWGVGVPILVMELPQDTRFSDMNAVHSNWDEMPPAHLVTAHSDGLAVDGSGVHFTGASLVTMGRERMWDAWERVHK